jgi:type I site-specific restriction endonuclease
MQKNGRVLSNRHSIEIIRDRITQLFGRLDENDAPDRLAVLEKLWEQYKEQKESGQNVEMTLTARKIDQAFEAARTDFAVWAQMIQLLDLDRKMVESEVKIAKEIKAIITAEEAFELVAKLMASIFSSVNSMESISIHDKGIILKRIQYEFTRIVGDNIGEEFEEGIGAGVGTTIDL